MSAEQEQKDITKNLTKLFAGSKNKTFVEASKRAQAQGISNPTDFVNFLADASGVDVNTVIGSTAVLIGEQWVDKETPELYGDIFKLGGTFETGGVYITIRPNNMVGKSTPTNYQTSTDTMSNIAWGNSFTTGEWLSLKVITTPLQNYQFNDNAIPFCTLGLTIPKEFYSFSSLSPIKANQIMTAWSDMVQDEKKIYFYGLGNMLFTDFLPQNQYTASSTNLYACLQQLIIPVIQYMKTPNARFNAGINYTNQLANGTTDGTYIQNLWAIPSSTLTTLNPYNALPDWEILQTPNSTSLIPYLNVKNPKLVIYMNPLTASAFLTLLMTSAIGRKDAIDIKTEGNVITSLCGVPVKIVGTLITPPAQASQGSPVIPTLDTGLALATGQVVIVDEDYLTWYKYYDRVFTTNDVMPQAMIDIMRLQLAYIPVVKPWLNGIVLDISSALDSANTLQVSTDNN